MYLGYSSGGKTENYNHMEWNKKYSEISFKR